MKVVQLLGLWGPWRCRVCRDTDCPHGRSYGPRRRSSEVAQSCPTTTLSMAFSRREYWSGLPFPSPEVFPTQGWNPGLPHCRQTLYRLNYQVQLAVVLSLILIEKEICSTWTFEPEPTLIPNSSAAKLTVRDNPSLPCRGLNKK